MKIEVKIRYNQLYLKINGQWIVKDITEELMINDFIMSDPNENNEIPEGFTLVKESLN